MFAERLTEVLFVSSKNNNSDTSLFAAVKDYLSVEKGWFSPYLFASARRPIIPRSMKPDVIFCHGPFLSGNSALLIALTSEDIAYGFYFLPFP